MLVDGSDGQINSLIRLQENKSCVSQSNVSDTQKPNCQSLGKRNVARIVTVQCLAHWQIMCVNTGKLSKLICILLLFSSLKKLCNVCAINKKKCWLIFQLRCHYFLSLHGNSII